MSNKKDLAKLRHQLKKKEERFLASLPEDKRLALERQAEIDIPTFLRDREERILKAYKGRRGQS